MNKKINPIKMPLSLYEGLYGGWGYCRAYKLCPNGAAQNTSMVACMGTNSCFSTSKGVICDGIILKCNG